jgi:hypothetical protein
MATRKVTTERNHHMPSIVLADETIGFTMGNMIAMVSIIISAIVTVGGGMIMLLIGIQKKVASIDAKLERFDALEHKVNMHHEALIRSGQLN